VSTDSTNTYSINDGTSLSAPVVSGIAAMILSYHPDLKPQQLIQLLLDSSRKIDDKVLVPGQTDAEKKKIKFSKLSKSGGIINAYTAMKQAEGR
jgi:subtilisin family serine protease